MRVERLEDRRLLAIMVNTLVDEADGSILDSDISLRDAIALASAGETIGFAPALTSSGPATIILTLGELVINKDLSVHGPGSVLMTIDASGNDPTPNSDNGDGSRVFNIDDGNVIADKSVTIRGLSLTGGDSGGGGAIFSSERLSVVESQITGNASGSWGGGIMSHEGTLSLSESTVSGNSAGEFGGGVFVLANSNAVVMASVITGNSAGEGGGGIETRFGSLTVTGSQVVENTADRFGGGIHNSYFGQTSVTSSTISGNTARWGGGIFNQSDSLAALTVASSTMGGNSAYYGGAIGNSDGDVEVTGSTLVNNDGGGIFNAHGRVSVSSSTISGNSTPRDGGGIYSQSGSLTLASSTISGNYSGNRAGGIYFFGSALNVLNVRHSTIAANSAGRFGGGIVAVGGLLALNHSLVATNTATLGPDVTRLFGGVNAHWSLIGNNSGTGLVEAPIGSPDANGNLIGGAMNGSVDPKLSVLADHGGATKTHGLLPGSPAIDAGDRNAAAGMNGVPLDDQRGAPFARVFDGEGTGVARIDMGALEAQPLPPECNFGSDGQCHLDDIDRLIAEIASGANNSAFDLTGDNFVNLNDRDEWLALAGALNLPSANPYLLGDANLDGFVDGSDFGTWNANKSTSVAAWSRADFNADGSVDGSDFGIWNSHKFTSADMRNRCASQPISVLDEHGMARRVRPSIAQMEYSDHEQFYTNEWRDDASWVAIVRRQRT